MNGNQPHNALGNSGTTANAPMPSATWVPRLFAKLALIYGHRWTSQWPDDAIREAAMREWTAGLDGISPHAVKAFLDRRGSEWPPSLAEIRAACKTNTLAAHQPFKALPRPKPDPDTVAARIANLRQALQ